MTELVDLIRELLVGAGIGMLIGMVGAGFIALINAGPFHVPIITPIWNLLRNTIERRLARPVQWLERKINATTEDRS